MRWIQWIIRIEHVAVLVDQIGSAIVDRQEYRGGTIAGSARQPPRATERGKTRCTWHATGACSGVIPARPHPAAILAVAVATEHIVATEHHIAAPVPIVRTRQCAELVLLYTAAL